ncbi:hypothetical protein IA539_12860 [Gordonia sp. zg691]|uniref:Serine hydrolase n=1 Tax=Gordonia jinghuaiqii TaxID=2758710 RepID=A0A7D7R1V1_9ACTN|nr:hypothetical protein [Gordonia jinghuaiqii]MBD0862098.1 hypothetical protein [Gordonia jinghuaiqii]MCR5978676.1 hypothetical protein [Gordonia jinghuaiqii]QMT02991.1 hypothetical protein H1R19_07700 [Gordonia jinghuaiqii]
MDNLTRFLGAWRNRWSPAALGCVVALVAGCATADPQPVAPVTVTVTAGSSATGYPMTPSPSSSTSAPANPYAGLAAGFAEVASSTGLTVGIAIAPVGGSAVPALTLGDPTPRVAWSTIKVPLAVAAQRQNGPSTAANAAIINSDNGSAEELWSSLGGGQAAADAVTAVLRQGGDPTTVVPAVARRAGFTIFGQTVWALPDAATFTARLPCMSGTQQVLSLMGQVAGNQQWGVEIMPAPRATAVKGGWGPGLSEGYLVRQIGLITFRDGGRAAVAMSAVGGSMSGGIAALNAVANWLNTNMPRLPRGRCSEER